MTDGPRAVAPVPPTPGSAPAEAHRDGELTIEPQSTNYAFQERASRCLVQVTAWLDANGNGLVDRGDAAGSFPHAMEVVDRGFIRGNMNRLSLRLSRVP